MTADVGLCGAKKPKTCEQQGKPEYQQSDKCFGSPLTYLLGDQPACLSDLAGKRHRLSHPPLVARIVRFQRKQHVLEPLKQFVRGRIAELHIPWIIREHVGSFLLWYSRRVSRAACVSEPYPSNFLAVSP